MGEIILKHQGKMDEMNGCYRFPDPLICKKAHKELNDLGYECVSVLDVLFVVDEMEGK